MPSRQQGSEDSRATRKSMNLFWFWWVTSTGLAATLSMFVANPFIVRHHDTADDFYRYLLLWGTIGVAQWLVLELNGKRIRLWAIATVAGGSVASYGFFFALDTKLLGVLGGDFEAAIASTPGYGTVLVGVSAALAGLVLGASQYLVLRRYPSKAMWWVLITVVAWTVSFVLVGPLVELTLYHFLYPSFYYLSLDNLRWDVVYHALHGAYLRPETAISAGILAGTNACITGWWLSRMRVVSRQPETSQDIDPQPSMPSTIPVRKSRRPTNGPAASL